MSIPPDRDTRLERDTPLERETPLKRGLAGESLILRAAGAMGLATAFSRILGFGRDWLMALTYGTSMPVQAFVVAFRIPNLFRDLVGEGAANTAFVPVLSQTRALEGRASFSVLAQATWIRLVIVFLGISILGILASPLFVRIIAPGFTGDPQLLTLTVRLTRILFPFLGLVGLAAFFMGVLNSLNVFAPPSLGPALLNLAMIFGILLWRTDCMGLAFGVIAGGILQLLIQWPFLKKAGLRLRLRFLSHPGVGQMGRLLLPRMAGSGVYQASVLVDTIFASFTQLVGQGAVASLYFAHRFLHLPLSLFGISMAQAALPTFARQAALMDLSGIQRTLTRSLRLSLFVALPSSLGLILMGGAIVRTLLEHGAFSSEATGMTVAALRMYAVGLGFFCASKVLTHTLYALKDTSTPVRSAAIAFSANVLLNALLIWPMGLSGLALATSLSSGVNCLHLYRKVSQRIGPWGRELAPFLFKVLASSIGMGLTVLGLWILGTEKGELLSPWGSVFWLLGSIAVGVASFFLFAYLLKVEESRELALWIFKRS